MNKIQTIAEYQQLASRTCVDLGSRELNIFHMNSGIVTEIGEALDPIKKYIAYGKPLDLVNIGEEIADAAWYISNRAMIVLEGRNLDFWEETEVTFENILSDFNEEFKEDISELKEEKESLMFFADLLYSIKPIEDLNICPREEAIGVPQMVILFKVAEYFKLDFWQLLTNNIAKLQVRYPEKFTNEAAINRDLGAEREQLEK